jgi:eukaryotic translation initiation factor 2C
LKAINCGTKRDPIYYAQEMLQIPPWQVYRRPVPDKLTGAMVKEAAKDPDVGRALIENEGLVKLGFTRQDTLGAQLGSIVSTSPSNLQAN